jgi:hypothetical protein
VFAIAGLAVLVALMFAAGLIWKGSSLNGGSTYFSWLLQGGASGILPVYALVAIAGAMHAYRHRSSLLDILVAPVVALIVVVAAEVTEFYKQPSPFKYAPYFMVGWMVLGVIVRLLTRSRVAPLETQAEMEMQEVVPELVATH